MRPRAEVSLAAVLFVAALLLSSAATPQSAAPKAQGAKSAQLLHKQLDGDLPIDWLDGDVPYIITPEERAAFHQLQNDEQREMFIESFWNRRDPTPDTVENEFKDEYYRRVVYANDQFSFDLPGWKTDRGRIYVSHGPPDAVDVSVPQKESWTYRYLEGIGSNVVVSFVDVCGCGDYRLQVPTALKNKLLSPPPFHDREIESTLTQQPPGTLIQYIGPVKAPQVRLKDLEQVVSNRIRYNMLPIGSHLDFVQATALTDLVLAGISINVKDLSWQERQDGSGTRDAQVNLFARVTALNGHVVAVFEDTISRSISAQDWPDAFNGQVYYRRTIPLPHGHCRLEIAVQDAKAERVGTLGTGIVVPPFASERPALSTLMFADEVRPNALTRALDPLTLGSDAVLPRIPPPGSTVPIFRRDETVHTWVHAGSLALDPKSHKPSLTVAYDIRNAAGKPVLQLTDTPDHVGSQLTLQQGFPAAKLPPGAYRISVTVNDRIAHSSNHADAAFAVE